jgi:hypothetical protein
VFKNRIGPPNWKKEGMEKPRRIRIFERLSYPQKMCPLYMCRSASFYREADGLLHSDNTLECREYSPYNYVLK